MTIFFLGTIGLCVILIIIFMVKINKIGKKFN